MTGSRWSIARWCAVAIAAFIAAGRLQEPLRDQRPGRMADPAVALDQAPPWVTFTTVALGGFRGLLVDLLWMRASELQDRGNYYELVQLAEWITRLQPRFASIWAFHAWNLAYNVSVMFPSPSDRWRWVRHGISLLRDDGLRFNPDSALLHRELAWMFQHKLGMDMDQAHHFYKRAWAEEIERALGGPRPEPGWEALAAAPRNAQELLRDERVADLLAQLRAAGWDPLLAPPEAEPKLPAALHDRWEHSQEGVRLRAWRRAQWLRQVYKLEPAVMHEIEQTLGAQLDWRTPYAHAIYWAWTGLPLARTKFDDLSLRRQIFQSLMSAYVRGRLTWDRRHDRVVLSPQPDLLPAALRAFEETLRRHPADPTVRQAHRNFLVDAIMISVTYQRRRDAEQLWQELRRNYPEPWPDSLQQFVAETWAGRLRDMDTAEALAAVESACYQSLLWRELGDPVAAEGYAELARWCWEVFMSKRTDPEWRERTGLPPLEVIFRQAAERLKTDLSPSANSRAP